ncbi:MAG: hypothetical protein Unbinned5858contig1001_6 [Prokaryotic dsDNA virus sp.]|nr:MAG: hypothetical protein Unbinned5858contig1001_6 [Prokaryotic dsDNA virus sp.]|tara:strand:- start:19226 stop:20635 length:1410 start_codon:yes stop_codon:yes gene_type:complete
MSLKDTANFGFVPSAYKNNKAYTIIPTNGNGDLYAQRTTNSSRIDSSGIVENVFANRPTLNYQVNNGLVVGCPELQIQMLRTNVLVDSENPKVTANGGLWSSSNCTQSTDTIEVSPSGIVGSTKLTENNNTGVHLIQQQMGLLQSGVQVPLVVNRKYMVSGWFKSGSTNGRSGCAFFITNNNGNDEMRFNIVDGYVSDTTTNINNKRARITKFPNGWFRCEFQFKAGTQTPTLQILIGKKNATTNTIDTNYNGNNAGNILVYGLQVETNSQSSASDVSSYIKTTLTPATRQRDYFNTGVGLSSPDMTNFPTNYPISVFWEGKIDRYASTHVLFHVCNKNTNKFGLHLIFHSNTQLKIRKTNQSGAVSDQLVNYVTERLDYMKILINYIDEQSVELFVNGYKIFQGNVGNVSYSGIGIGIGRNVTNDANQRQSTNGVFLWNKKLTDVEGIQLTSSSSFSELATSQNYEIQ